MSKLGLCASCETLQFTKPVLSTKKANWLKELNYVNHFIEKTPLKKHKEYTFNIMKELHVGKENKGKFVLYWASEPGDSFNIKNAKEAYSHFKNYGVSEVSTDGKITIWIRNPQIYKDKDNKGDDVFFPKHIHFLFSDETQQHWKTDKIYTQMILGYYNLTSLMKEIKNKTSIVINVLDYKYYAIDHIPGSFSLPRDGLKSMTEDELQNYLIDIIHYNNLKFIKNKIDKDNFNIKHIPIILYCASKECNLSEIAAHDFVSRGYVNLSTFPDGMRGFHIKDIIDESPIYSKSKTLSKHNKNKLNTSKKRK